MRARWQVVVVGVGWDYRDPDVRKFVTRFAARRYANALNARQFVVPLHVAVEAVR